MLQNILKLEGIDLLNKKEQGNVRGGFQWCRLTVVTNGQSEIIFHGFGGISPSDPSASDSANSACVDYVSNGADRCFYDCAHDGFGV